MKARHGHAFDLCARLLRGEVVDVTDDAGRVWRATATSLAVLYRGEPEPLIENVDAFEVAAALTRRTSACTVEPQNRPYRSSRSTPKKSSSAPTTPCIGPSIDPTGTKSFA
jgi:hypothetical protein